MPRTVELLSPGLNYYHRNIEQHIIPAIGDIPLNKLTTRDLQKFYNDLQSNGRVRKRQG